MNKTPTQIDGIGYSFQRIIENYPALVEHDIRAAIEYARSVVNDEEVILL